jgi:tetratricopeptide (TPR) repeat protein
LAIDREATLKNAEKFLRVGRLDAAIAEYARIVDDQPHDWATGNTLGDLYMRAKQPDRAVALYTRIAGHLRTEGFYPKAAALYKKILKITPDDEAAQLHLAELSVRQGMLADARAYFGAVANRRRQRQDAAGADEIVIRLGAIDPADLGARLAAARARKGSVTCRPPRAGIESSMTSSPRRNARKRRPRLSGTVSAATPRCRTPSCWCRSRQPSFAPGGSSLHALCSGTPSR